MNAGSLDFPESRGKCHPLSPLLALSCWAMLYLITFLYFNTTALAITPSTLAAHPFSDTEQWVLEQIKVGDVANLRKRKVFTEKADRVLSAHFLSYLLTEHLEGAEEPHRMVRIVHAVLSQPVDLTKKEILYEAELIDCQFEDSVNLSKSTFRKKISFKNSSFKEVNIGKAVFAGPVSFESADITGDFRAEGVRFTLADATPDFSGMQVGELVDFTQAEFAGGVSFNKAKVDGDADFTQATFDGEVNFAEAHIAHHFLAGNTQFRNKTKGAFFSNMQVGGNANFTNATFEEMVTFTETYIAHNFVAMNTQFTNKEEEAFFTNMQVGGNASFHKAKFFGYVNFDGVDIAGRFFANEALMVKEAKFNEIRVGRDTKFENTVFKDKAMMKQAKFQSVWIQGPGKNIYGPPLFRAGDLAYSTNFVGKLRDAPDPLSQFLKKHFSPETRQLLDKYQSTEPPPQSLQNALIEELNHLLRGNSLYDEQPFKAVTLREKTSKLIGEKPQGEDLISLNRLLLEDAYPHEIAKNTVPFGLDLSGSVIQGTLNIEGVVLDYLDAKLLTVEGPMFLKDLSFMGKVDLEDSSLNILRLCGVSSLPENSKLFGMTYRYISAAGYSSPETVGHDSGKCIEKMDQSELVKLLDHAEFNPSVYTELEAFFKRQGAFDEADKVFIREKRRMRDRLEGFEWWLNLWQDVTMAYGRQPGRILACAGFFIFLGTLVFSRKDGMVLQNRADVTPRFSAFMYSLDLFLPIIDLHAASIWTPRENRWFAQKYVSVHMVIGRIIILLSGAIYSKFFAL